MLNANILWSRRRVLQTSLVGVAMAKISGVAISGATQAQDPVAGSAKAELPAPLSNEDAIGYVHRIAGRWDIDLYRKVLGAANEYKEGDEIIGIAASSRLKGNMQGSFWIERRSSRSINIPPSKTACSN